MSDVRAGAVGITATLGLPGASGQREVLRQPHVERVFLAGEAMHRGQQALVSGADLEGQRAAADPVLA